jgi:hypothetical protein
MDSVTAVAVPERKGTAEDEAVDSFPSPSPCSSPFAFFDNRPTSFSPSLRSKSAPSARVRFRTDGMEEEGVEVVEVEVTTEAVEVVTALVDG